MEEYTVRPVARIHTDFPGKFGIPRQAGIVNGLEAEIVFEEEFANRAAIRGLEQFSHLWLIWQFSENTGREWSPTVRPPRLGGNERVGVFATRSPFRPNSLGLSCVRLLRIEERDGQMPVPVVAGADMVDGTPIFDIKPYIPYADCVPEATGGFAPDSGKRLKVYIPEKCLEIIPENKRESLKELLSLDPRPQYKQGGDRVYRFEFAGVRIGFTCDGESIRVLSTESIGTIA